MQHLIGGYQFSNSCVMPQSHCLALTCIPSTKALGLIDFLTLQTYLDLRPPPKFNQLFPGQKHEQQFHRSGLKT